MMRILAISVLLLMLVPGGATEAYWYCGCLDGVLPLQVHYAASRDWIPHLEDQIEQWNAVHEALALDVVQASEASLGEDGVSVVTWLDEVDLQAAYGIGWDGNVAYTFWSLDGECGRILEADVVFNPDRVTVFDPQDTVPYEHLGFQEVALHELGHVLTLRHENRVLSVMTSGAPVSNVLYADDKIGWRTSAASCLADVRDQQDVGVFPLRNAGEDKAYGFVAPATIGAGGTFRVVHITVQNLSSDIRVDAPHFDLVLVGEETHSIGWIAFEYMEGGSWWDGGLDAALPAPVGPGTYRVELRYRGEDDDPSNDVAIFGELEVTP